MRIGKSRESGQVLIMALMLVAMASLMVTPLLRQSISNLGFHQTIECRTLNGYSADAGIEYATGKIYANSGYYIDNPMADNFTVNGRTVNVTAVYGGAGSYEVTSSALSEDCGKTTISAIINISVGAFAFAVASKTDISISNSSIDSSPDPGEGHIYANQDISITGSELVNGDASAGGLITNGRENILGTIEEGADELAFPTVNDALYRQIAQEGGNYTGTLTLDGGVHDVGPLYITGDLDVKPNTTVNLLGPLYVVGDVKVNQGHIEGSEHVLSEGRVDLTGGGYGSENIPVIISINDDIDLVGPIVDAVLYAPEGTVSVTNLQLFGALGGWRCTVSNADIVYSESLHGRQDLPGSELFPLTYQYN
jgi:hypothetical protein